MDAATKRRVRDEASVTVLRATTAINVAIFELTDEKVPPREVYRALVTAHNQLGETIAIIKRTLGA